MKNPLLPLVLLVVVVLAQSGCLHHTFSIGNGAPDGGLVYKSWHHHWLFGIIRPDHQKNVEVRKLCASGNATIYEKTSFVNGLVDILTWFIYSPTTVTILCEDGRQAEISISPTEVQRIVHDPLFREVVADLLPDRLAETDRALDRIRLASVPPSRPAL